MKLILLGITLLATATNALAADKLVNTLSWNTASSGRAPKKRWCYSAAVVVLYLCSTTAP